MAAQSQIETNIMPAKIEGFIGFTNQKDLRQTQLDCNA
jgi:hypothetical protein